MNLPVSVRAVPQMRESAVRCSSPSPSPCPRCGKSPCVCARPDTTVELTFSADRNALYTAWNAVANLADLAGTLTVTVRAESAKGFDKTRLQNGVIEPLREADLIE